VNNRDGSSGPGYPDQREIDWSQIGVEPELTTVTKLPRRLFTFSQQQLTEAHWHNGGYWKTSLFLNFCNYMTKGPTGPNELHRLIKEIEAVGPMRLNPPRIEYFGLGADDVNVYSRDEYYGH
jgi:hypothetical protein